MTLRPMASAAVIGLRNSLNPAINRRWDKDQFGTQPHVSREQFLSLFQAARAVPISEELAYAWATRTAGSGAQAPGKP